MGVYPQQKYQPLAGHAVVLRIAGLPEPLKHKPSDTIPFYFLKKCGHATTLQTLEKDKVI
jgi:hypothetical protein